MIQLLIDDEELLSFKDLEWSKKNLPVLPVGEENEQKEENTQAQGKKPAAKNRRRVCLNVYCCLLLQLDCSFSLCVCQRSNHKII